MSVKKNFPKCYNFMEYRIENEMSDDEYEFGAGLINAGKGVDKEIKKTKLAGAPLILINYLCREGFSSSVVEHWEPETLRGLNYMYFMQHEENGVVIDVEALFENEMKRYGIEHASYTVGDLYTGSSVNWAEVHLKDQIENLLTKYPAILTYWENEKTARDEEELIIKDMPEFLFHELD